MAEHKTYIEKIEADIVAKEKKAEANYKKAEKTKYIFIGIFLALWLIGLLVLTGARYIPTWQYTKAVTAFDNKNFKEAALTFEELDGLGSSEYYMEKIYAQFPQYKLINAEIGELFHYGMYSQEQNIAPIEWYVIAKENNRVLLLSRHIIDAQPFSGEVKLHAWLEKNFRETAFNDREVASVSEILILNRQQVDSYVSGKTFASCEPTTFALSRGYYTNYSGDYMWWIDELGSSGKHFLVSQSGYAGRDVCEDTKNNGVRPAIWVSLE